MTLSTFLKKLLGLVGILQLTFTIGAAKSNQSEGLITKICLARFQAEMAEANKTPPKGMGIFTCKCFVSKLNNGSSFSSAKTSCKTQASKKFDL